MRRQQLVVLMIAGAARVAAADTLELPALGARATARAGAAMLAVDDGVALLLDPASLARRSTPRVTAGLAAVRQTATFTSDASFPAGSAPPVDSRPPVLLRPWGGGAFGIGDRVVVGAAVFAPTSAHHRYASPAGDFDPTKDDRALFPQRYGGERLVLERWGAGAGAAVRVLPWLAVGAAALVHRTELAHELMIWAGPPETAGLQLGDLSPAFDMRFRASASAWSPGASVGLVIAPLDVPVEIGLGATWSAPAQLSGEPRLTDSRGVTAGVREAVAGVDPDATAELELPAPFTTRAGLRLLFGRLALELDGELAFVSGAPAWELRGVSVTPSGQPTVELLRVPLGPALRERMAVRAAVDVELVPGVVALLGGYAFTGRRVEDDSVTPVWPDADSHTLSLGVEARVAAATVTLGVLHEFRPARHPGDSRLRVIDPRGDLVVRAATGESESAVTLVALDAEIAFE